MARHWASGVTQPTHPLKQLRSITSDMHHGRAEGRSVSPSYLVGRSLTSDPLHDHAALPIVARANGDVGQQLQHSRTAAAETGPRRSGRSRTCIGAGPSLQRPHSRGWSAPATGVSFGGTRASTLDWSTSAPAGARWASRRRFIASGPPRR
eukprot:1232404-Pyramimonas_sp.AAC.1